jgi:hypothetical protein
MKSAYGPMVDAVGIEFVLRGPTSVERTRGSSGSAAGAVIDILYITHIMAVTLKKDA